jgi:heme/copper-type cytochrome/quinol oxidase subunit 1
MYFWFVIAAACVGLVLATLIRVELSYPGFSIFDNDSERYLTVVSMHAIVMVFFVVIPVIFGAFGNFLLPLQLGVRDVAFPRLNSFMFWVTPSGLILLMHVLLYDNIGVTPVDTGALRCSVTTDVGEVVDVGGEATSARDAS